MSKTRTPLKTGPISSAPEGQVFPSFIVAQFVLLLLEIGQSGNMLCYVLNYSPYRVIVYYQQHFYYIVMGLIGGENRSILVAFVSTTEVCPENH